MGIYEEIVFLGRVGRLMDYFSVFNNNKNAYLLYIMASTRSRNTPGNYCLEQREVQHSINYIVDRDYAYVPQTLMAGDGLVQGRMGNAVLAQNPQDIESFLFGIGSTNLVTPAASPFSAQVMQHPALSIVDRQVQLLMPAPLTVQNDQRQYPMSSDKPLVIRN